MLEFLWVTNDVDAQSPPVLSAGDRRTQPPPFESWTYRPEYSPIAIGIGVNSHRAAEPLLFYLPVKRRFTEGDTAFVQLTFDVGVAQKRRDFRPALPLAFQW